MGSIGPRTAHPGRAELRRRAAATYRRFQKNPLLPAGLLHARAVIRGLVCLFVCVCVWEGIRGGYITAMLLSNCLLLSLVTTMTSVIGISAFCLHCRASTTLHAAFSLPRAAGPMPHKYKHNLSYTSWLQDRTPHISCPWSAAHLHTY